MKSFLVALQFLTILPVKIKSGVEEKDLGRSLLYFPAVGLLLGLMLILPTSYYLNLPVLVMSAAILILSAFITGGIHLDGFSDTCDGFYGSKNTEKILEIMRDSRVGAMGVVGVVLLLLIKFSLMASTPVAYLWKILIVMCVFSRWSQALACNTVGYAREEGKARHFVENAKKRDLVIGGAFTLFVSIFLMSLTGIVLFFVSLVPVCAFLYYVKRKICGVTGDTIGAVNEIAEVSVLLFGLILTGIPA